MRKRVLVGAFALGLLSLSTGVFAQNTTTTTATPWYLGLGISTNSAKIPEKTVAAINTELSTALGTTTTIINRDDTSTGYKIFLGYSFNRYLAVEAGYVELGKPRVEYDFRTAAVPSASAGTYMIEYHMDSTFADVVGTLPVYDNWSAIGRVGVGAGRTRLRTTGQPVTLPVSSSGERETQVRAKFGAGLEYSFSSQFKFRGEWERYQMPDPFSTDTVKVDAFAASVLFAF